MAETHIQWSQRVWNPTTGCDKVSPGCGLPRPGTDDEATGRTGGCYALSMAKRLKGMGQAKYQNDGDPKTSGPGFGLTIHEDALTLPLRWRKPSKIFVNSMSDLFHKDVPITFLADVFAVMSASPQHVFQVLTKRHARMRSLLREPGFAGLVEEAQMAYTHSRDGFVWPLPNVHLGVSAEDQHWADIRIPALLETPAAVRWVSAEPLLGPIDLKLTEEAGECTCGGYCAPYYQHERGCGLLQGPGYGIDWVVCGGESGPGARPCDPDWIRSILKQCASAGVPAFNKQLGSVWASEWLLSAHRDPKAGNPEYWPEDLRIRQYPVVDEASDVSRGVASDASYTPSPAKSLAVREGL